MNEKGLCSELVKSLNQVEYAYCWKIPDVGRRTGQLFIPARSFDITLCYKGQYLAIEVKCIKSPSSFNASRITEFEDRSLLAVEKAGGAAFLFIGYWFKPTEKQQEKYNLPARVKIIYYKRYFEIDRLLVENNNVLPYQEIISWPSLTFKKGAWSTDFLRDTVPSHLKWKPFLIRT